VQAPPESDADYVDRLLREIEHSPSQRLLSQETPQAQVIHQDLLDLNAIVGIGNTPSELASIMTREGRSAGSSFLAVSALESDNAQQPQSSVTSAQESEDESGEAHHEILNRGRISNIRSAEGPMDESQSKRSQSQQFAPPLGDNGLGQSDPRA
jgi:hypothetical protein